jgi:serine/threonine protein kinase
MASNYDLYSSGLTQGTLLNSRFEILEKIGQGGFGQVYSAHDNENRGEK